MRSQRTIIALSLLVSVLVHLGALLWGLHYGITRLPPLAETVATRAPNASTTEILPPPPEPPPPLPSEMMLGEADHTGDAIDEFLSDREQQAPEADQNQAALTRHAPGSPTEKSPSQQSTFQNLQPPEQATTLEVASALKVERSPLGLPGLPKETTAPLADKQSSAPVAAAQAPAAPPTVAQAPASPPADVTDNTNVSDRDSSAFSTKAGIDIIDGRVVARPGRSFKFSRPHTNLAAYFDPLELTPPVVLVMSLSVEPTGKISRVVITRSSGSRGLDRVIELAMYESTCDPAHDADGRPMKDEFPFSIVIR
jgi:cytoskeletal protein RodZ